MRWLLVFVIACLLFNSLGRWLQKIGLGRLPGDFHFIWRGREWNIPLASSIVLSVLMMLVGLLF